MATFTDEHRKFAKAVYQDMVKTYPHVTLDMVMNRAKLLIEAGEKPSQIIDVFLEQTYKRAGLI